jgi:hypothetical protein
MVNYLYAQLLEEGKSVFRDAVGNAVPLPERLKLINVLCLVADDHSALSSLCHSYQPSLSRSKSSVLAKTLEQSSHRSFPGSTLSRVW